MAKIKMTDKRREFVHAALDVLGSDTKIIDRTKIAEVLDAYDGLSFPAWAVGKELKTEVRGEYYLPTLDGEYEKDAPSNMNQAPVKTAEGSVSTIAMVPSAIGVMDQQDSYIPEKFDGYVPWGNFNTVKSVVKSGIFYPIFITGQSGNGKTLMVKEICAKLKREYVRANITVETDEDDLIGGFRLLNGETVWHDGPVVTAMKRGAVLLLDEIDLASNKIMALQPVLEGSSIYLKKIGKWVHPAKGFTVVATANTKGQGSDDGRFIGTNVLNEAFLERFPVTIEQSYPSASMEKKILNNELGKHDLKDGEFSDNLVKWADVIRKTFYEGGCDEIISTRRLVHIVGAFSIFNDKMKAIELTVNRFDAETKESFLDLYTKIDAGADVESLVEKQNDSEDDDEEEEDYSF
jgi:MoxR-like ATPase|tara:strand:- start:887 stop:2104 length:1218 start_codon:yes stop_codon:yes gene_type:complete